MPRLIDADVLKYAKFHGVTDWTPTEETSYQRGWNDAIDAIMRNAPTVEPKHGRWEFAYMLYGSVKVSKCSVCEHLDDLESNYCPNCGAKMEEVMEDEID